MDIDTAREMLAAATGAIQVRDKDGHERDHHEIGREELARGLARGQIERQAVPTLAAYMLAVEALNKVDAYAAAYSLCAEHEFTPHDCPWEATAKALAAWREL